MKIVLNLKYNFLYFDGFEQSQTNLLFPYTGSEVEGPVSSEQHDARHSEQTAG